jgi:inner membrane protein
MDEGVSMKKISDFRVVGIIGVAFALWIALSMIEGLGAQRQGQRVVATQSIAASVAGAPTLIGPWISRQCEETYVESTKTSYTENEKTKLRDEIKTLKRSYVLQTLPEQSQFSGAIKIEQRYRGIYKANVLGAELTGSANWLTLSELAQPAVKAPVMKIECSPITMQFYVSDQRTLRDAKLTLNATSVEARSGTRHPQFGTGFSANIPEEWTQRITPVEAKLTLQLVGTEAIEIVPLAKSNAIAMQANWPHPSFIGAFLPTEHSITNEGFTARWAISSLSSDARVQFSDGNAKPTHLQGLRVQFIDPINPAVLSERATKYGVLFVLLTFVGVGALQVLRKLSIHPMQYFMTGAALAVFFLLLISLSEHIAFRTAYAIAAGACALLLGVYAVGMLRSRLRATGFGAAIAALYGLLYLVLKSEQHALLAGSLTVFAALATMMLLTRNFDWAALFARTPQATAFEPEVAEAQA